MHKFSVWLVGFLLKRGNLSLKDRNKLISYILEDLHALPISSIISVSDGGELLLNGRSLDLEKAKQLRESARLALDNVSFKVVNQEVLFMAVVGGLHKALSPEDLYFYRAAIWFGQRLEEQLKILAQRTDDE